MSAWKLNAAKPCFLHLKGWVLEDTEATLENYSTFDQAFQKWDHSSRISPVFPFKGAKPLPKFSTLEKAWVCFFGPIFPGALSAYELTSLHLTLGIYNLLAFTESEVEKNLVERIANEKHVGWETWHLEKGALKLVDHWSPKLNTIPPPFKRRSRARPKTPLITDSGLEYTTQMATAYLRAEHYWPEYAETLEVFDEKFNQRLSLLHQEQGTAIFDYNIHDHYVMANTALSQQTELTYTGVSPVSENSGHCAMHSLLGIGIASKALQNLTGFISSAFAQAAFMTRIQKLAERKPWGGAHSSLFNADLNKDFSRIDPLSEEFLELKEKLSPESIVSCLSFFSARDGFRSTLLTVSAPFEVISSANTQPWTLQTMTHEMTHILIRGILARLLPPTHNLQAMQSLCERLNSTPGSARYLTLADQLAEFLCLAAWELDQQSLVLPSAQERKKSPDKDEELSQMLDRHLGEIDEIMTHCFDFLYFYQKDGDQYVESIWESWEVIPHITDRVPDYVIRTACALLTLNLNRENEIEITLDQLKAKLEYIQQKHPSSTNYIHKAINLLDYHRSDIHNEVQRRVHLVKIVRYFLYSPEVSQNIHQDTAATGKNAGDRARGNYPMKWLEFNRLLPKNPLGFIAAYTRDKDSNPVRTAWMLHHLAFDPDLIL